MAGNRKATEHRLKKMNKKEIKEIKQPDKEKQLILKFHLYKTKVLENKIFRFIFFLFFKLGLL